ncbi:MAG: glycosyltransferase family 2 protein [Alphaproteobacteria bacterium]|nr:MAG: glycosyltransferase family 2 protein [Alphaproteobacteria bacterium]
MTSTMAPRLALSIVSHGQGHLIRPLLDDLIAIREQIAEVLVTLNIPEDEAFLEGFRDRLPIRVRRNDRRQGFGMNHNAAFSESTSPFFVVVNPDIRLPNFAMDELLSNAANPCVGVAAPIVHASNGQLQDSARRFPTLSRLIRRKMGGRISPDYAIGQQPLDVDWVAGMFMVFRRDVYSSIGGFDDRYFMYFEDVDLCYRLHSTGLRVRLVPQARVVHDAQRASRRKLQHFLWHVSSACRYLRTVGRLPRGSLSGNS